MLTQVQQRTFWGGGYRKGPDPDAFDPKKDYYKDLDLKKGAKQEDIKNMYYKKCYEYHPDRAGDMHQDKFKAINIAYDVLKEEDKRKEYDAAREEHLNGPKQSHQEGYESYSKKTYGRSNDHTGKKTPFDWANTKSEAEKFAN